MARKEFTSHEKDFLLLNDILQTLKNIGLTITKSGSEAEGYDIYYEFQLPTARLHFGTLVALVNTPEKFQAPQGQINYWQNVRIKENEITTTKYSEKDVANAIETLAFAKEIEKDTDKEYLSLTTKVIALTQLGLASVNSKKYLHEAEKERNAQIIHNSTVSTNFWMRTFTGTLAFIGLGTLLMQFYTSILRPPPPPALVLKESYKRCGIDSIYIVNDSLPPLSGARNKASGKNR